MLKTIAGTAETIPPALLEAFPELGAMRLRRGGLPPRVGGWCLGRSCVDGITLGSTVWLAPHARVSAALLLHELCHVRQFAGRRGFPLRYAWESLRRGYLANRFEVEARRFADERLRRGPGPPPHEDA